MVVTVTADGNLYVDDDDESMPPRTDQEIQARAAAILKRNPEARFLVRGDQSVEYRHVVNAMVLLQQAGVPSVGLVTEQPDGS